MQTEFKLLDHGYLKLVESWGSDEAIIRAARMSTDKGFLGWGPIRKCSRPSCGSGDFDFDAGKCRVCGSTDFESRPGDEKLLRYLWEHEHSTPFEMPGLTIEVQAPIMVFREWHRHRVPFGYAELSARYTPLPDVNYIPSVERLMMGSDGKNKQAGTVKGAEALTEENAKSFQEGLRLIYCNAEQLYQTALANGVPKELARVHLPVGRYSRMRATGNLRGWTKFLILRMAPFAQWEIRQYAQAVGHLIGDVFPRTWALFSESFDKERA